MIESQICLGEIQVDVVLKNIKNLHLSVYPPTGRVRIAAPEHMDMAVIRAYAISKLAWIKQQQSKQVHQARETAREYLDRESHYLWGKRYLLKIEYHDQPPEIELQHKYILMRIRPGLDAAKRRDSMRAWYRKQLKKAVTDLLAIWQPVIGAKAEQFFIQRMKTRWGSCNFQAQTIRLNLELAKKPRKCLTYILVHELVHLLEPTHSPRFQHLLEKAMPDWRFHRDILNQAPLAHIDWTY